MRLVPQFAVPKKDSDELRPISVMTASGFNLGISKDASKVRYDNLVDLGPYLRHLYHILGELPGHLYKCDVSKAYRLLPMRPLVMLLQVVETFELSSKRTYRIDWFGVFRNRYMPRLWCTFFGMVVWSLRFHVKIEIPLHYTDDQFGYDKSPQLELYSHTNEARLIPRDQKTTLLFWDYLGIPHSWSKQEFGRSLVIIGFQVNLNGLTISLSTAARLKVLAEIRNFLAAPNHKLQKWWSFLGYLNWALK